VGLTATRRLTAHKLNGLRSKSKAYTVGDVTVPGLLVYVGPTLADGSAGARSWWFRFYWKGKRQTLTLGQYPDVAIGAAQDRAREARGLLDRGIDPRDAGLTRRRAPSSPIAPPGAAADENPHSVTALVDLFMERHVTPHRKRPELVRWVLDRYVLTEWTDRDARTIKPKDVRGLLDGIVDRGSRVQANRVAAILRQLFLFAVDREVIEASPVQLLRPPGGKEKPRDRALTDRELAAFLSDPYAATRQERLAHVITLLLLTAARRGELAAARWRDVDLKGKTWAVPKENSKTGRAHVVPLSDAAIKEFTALKNLAGRSVWVLPGTDPKAPLDPKLLTRSLAKCRARFKKRGIDAFTLHDLRRTCRTGLGRLRVPPHVAEMVLNHTQAGIVGVYDTYTYLDERREALDRWAEHLANLGSQ
jgi:integrase